MQVSQAHSVRQYLIELQAQITSSLHDLDGTPFVVDAWKKPEGEMLQGENLLKIFYRRGPDGSRVPRIFYLLRP